MPTNMTTRLLDLCARWWRLPLLALALALAACGPGSGGTGTGPVMGSSFSFSGNTGGASVPGSITSPGCTTDCDRASLLLDTTRVELTALCRRFVFNGAWAVDATGLLVLNGTLETVTTTGTASTPATLRLQFSEGVVASPLVTFTLTGEKGVVVLGPSTLSRGDAAAGTAPPACVQAP